MALINGRLVALVAIILLSLMTFMPIHKLGHFTNRLKLSHSMRTHVKELALGAWILLGIGLLLHSFVMKGTSLYALFFAIAFLVWLNLKIKDDDQERRNAAKARDALVRSVLRIPLDDLHYMGFTEDTIDRILRDSSLRVKYFQALEALHLDLDEILRANIPRRELEELFKEAEKSSSDTDNRK